MTEWLYCPECKRDLVEGDEGCPSCPEGHFTKYPTPVAATIGLVRNNNQYLIIKRARPPRQGYWDLPGGFVHPEETSIDTLHREIFEETGLKVETKEFLGTFPSIYGETGTATLAAAYVFEASTRRVTLSEENNDYRWCDLNKIPELAFADCEQAVEMLKKLQP